MTEIDIWDSPEQIAAPLRFAVAEWNGSSGLEYQLDLVLGKARRADVLFCATERMVATMIRRRRPDADENPFIILTAALSSSASGSYGIEIIGRARGEPEFRHMAIQRAIANPIDCDADEVSILQALAVLRVSPVVDINRITGVQVYSSLDGIPAAGLIDRTLHLAAAANHFEQSFSA